MIRSRILTGAHELAFTRCACRRIVLRDGEGGGTAFPSPNPDPMPRVFSGDSPQSLQHPQRVWRFSYMPWVRLDDHFDENAKIASVGPLGLALWVTTLAYCNRNLTDGFIPWSKAHSLVSWEYLDAGADGDPLRRIAKTNGSERGEDMVSAWAVTSDDVIVLLLDAGLWEAVDGGYQIHDYAEFQPSKESVMADREAAKERMSRVRTNRGKRSDDVQANKERSSLNPVSDPVPVPKSVSDPVPDPKPEPQQKRFQPNPSSIRTRLWEVYTDLTSRLTPPTYEEDQIQHWEELGCSEEHIEAALRAVADANPEKRWPFFKARLGELLVKPLVEAPKFGRSQRVAIVRDEA